MTAHRCAEPALYGRRIEPILYEDIHRGRTAEQIAEEFDTLTLEEVYATSLYYLRRRPPGRLAEPLPCRVYAPALRDYPWPRG